MLRRIFLILLFAAAPLSLAHADKGAGNDRLVVFGNFAELTDHTRPGTLANAVVWLQVLEALVRFDRTGALRLAQAKSVTANADNTVYTITLRDDVFWSDGRPVLANDFVQTIVELSKAERRVGETATLQAIRGFKGNSAATPEGALGYYALDEKTIMLELVAPRSEEDILLALSSAEFLPRPMHMVDRHGEDWVKIDNFVGNGPYLPTGYSTPNTLDLVANPSNISTPFDYGRVTLTSEPMTADRFHEIMNEDYDAVVNFDSSSLARWVNVPEGTTFASANKPSFHFLSFGQMSGAAADPRVRQAVTMAIDREQLARRMLGPLEFEPTYTVGGGSAFMADWDLPLPDWLTDGDERLVTARSLMQDAGYSTTNRLKLKLKVQRDNPNSEQLANAIAYYLSAIHIEISTEFEPVPQHYFTIFDEPKAYDIAHLIWHSGNTVSGSAYSGAFGDGISSLFPENSDLFKQKFLAFGSADHDESLIEIAAELELATQMYNPIVPLARSQTGSVTFGGRDIVDMGAMAPEAIFIAANVSRRSR